MAARPCPYASAASAHAPRALAQRPHSWAVQSTIAGAIVRPERHASRIAATAAWRSAPRCVRLLRSISPSARLERRSTRKGESGRGSVSRLAEGRDRRLEIRRYPTATIPSEQAAADVLEVSGSEEPRPASRRAPLGRRKWTRRDRPAPPLRRSVHEGSHQRWLGSLVVRVNPVGLPSGPPQRGRMRPRGLPWRPCVRGVPGGLSRDC